MKIISIAVVGLRYHGFGKHPEKLKEVKPGQRVSGSHDTENPNHQECVMMMLGKTKLGYVRAGRNLATVNEWMKRTGKRSVMARFVELAEEYNSVFVNLEVDDDFCFRYEPQIEMLEGWGSDVKPLTSPKEQAELTNKTLMLQQLLADGPTCWDVEMQNCLDVISQQGWSDLSGSAFADYNTIIYQLDDLSQQNPDFVRPMRDLEHIVSHMGSREVTAQRVEWMRRCAQSREVRRMIERAGHSVDDIVSDLPCLDDEWTEHDLAELLSTIWYKRIERNQLRRVLAVVAMHLQLDGEVIDDAPSNQVVPANPVDPADPVAPVDPANPANILATPQAMQLWHIAQQHQWVDANLQPMRNQRPMAIIASVMRQILGEEKCPWRCFEQLWGIKDLSTKRSQSLDNKYNGDLTLEVWKAMDPENHFHQYNDRKR